MLFPSYKGRTVTLQTADSAHISDYWDEGSRAYARAFNPVTGYGIDGLPGFDQQTSNNPHGARIGSMPITPDVGLMEHVYSGRVNYIAVTLHPDSDWKAWI